MNRIYFIKDVNIKDLFIYLLRIYKDLFLKTKNPRVFHRTYIVEK